MTEGYEAGVATSEIKVRVLGGPHLMLRRAEVVDVQGYIRNVGPIEPVHFVETTKRAEIVRDYKDRSMWEAIPRGRADERVFDERSGEDSA